MLPPQFFPGLSIPLLASMLTVSACSTAPAPVQTASSIPANLLAPPLELPAFPRTGDGTMGGGQCLVGALDLYAAAGAIRLQLTTLQAMLDEQKKVAE